MPRKVYAVVRGRNPGIFDDWQSCQKQIKGFKNNLHRGFTKRSQAVAFLLEHGLDSNGQPAAAPAAAASGGTSSATGMKQQREATPQNGIPMFNSNFLAQMRDVCAAGELAFDGPSIFACPMCEYAAAKYDSGACPVHDPQNMFASSGSAAGQAPAAPAAAAAAGAKPGPAGSTADSAGPPAPAPYAPQPWVAAVHSQFDTRSSLLGAGVVITVGAREVATLAQPCDDDCTGLQALYAGLISATRLLRGLLHHVQVGDIDAAPPSSITVQCTDKLSMRITTEGGNLNEGRAYLRELQDVLDAQEAALNDEALLLGGWSRAAGWPNGVPKVQWRSVPHSEVKQARKASRSACSSALRQGEGGSGAGVYMSVLCAEDGVPYADHHRGWARWGKGCEGAAQYFGAEDSSDSGDGSDTHSCSDDGCSDDEGATDDESSESGGDGGYSHGGHGYVGGYGGGYRGYYY